MGNISAHLSLHTCNKCFEEQDSSGFEFMKSGYMRPMCKNCYNKRRSELHGGALRQSEARKLKAQVIIDAIPNCSLEREYVHESGAIMVVIKIKDFEWPIRRSSFLEGVRPWSRFCPQTYRKGYYVYRFEDIDGNYLYIGKSRNLTYRVSQHFCPSESKGNYKWKNDVRRVFVATCKTESDMHFLEIYLINKHKPKHNSGDISEDELTYTINEPEFKEVWVPRVSDRE